MERVFVAVISFTVIFYTLQESRKYPAKSLVEILLLSVAEVTFAAEVYFAAKGQDWGWFAGGMSGVLLVSFWLGVRLWDHFQGDPIVRVSQQNSRMLARHRSKRDRDRCSR